MSEAEKIISKLQLSPHIEGGYFRRTYESNLVIDTQREGETRRIFSTILYLLTSKQPYTFFSKSKSDIIHYFHDGEPLEFTLISDTGEIKKKFLGSPKWEGYFPQILVPSGTWKSYGFSQGSYSLISEAVSPEFDYRDMTLLKLQELKNLIPHHFEQYRNQVLTSD